MLTSLTGSVMAKQEASQKTSWSSPQIILFVIIPPHSVVPGKAPGSTVTQDTTCILLHPALGLMEKLKPRPPARAIARVPGARSETGAESV